MNIYNLKDEVMNVAAPAEKNTQQAEQKKKQRQVESLSLPLRETENANAQTQKPGTPNKGTSSESNNMLSNHNGIPAVHGSQTAYSKGSDLMHNELKASLEQTGDLNHPETQQKELDYKKTLGISDLRDYNDIKSGTYVPKTPAEQVAMVEVPKSSPEPSATAKTPNPEAKKAEGKDMIQQPVVADKTAEGEQQAETKTPQTATDNPGFIALQGQITATAKGQQQHEPASKSSQDAQAAAPSPANERESRAQASQVNVMDAQEPGVFSAADFKAQLKKKIESIQLPKNEEAADDFEKNNNIKEVNDQALGDVKQEKNAASGAIASETSKKPNTAAQPARNVAKMPVPNHGKAPAVANVAKAMPAKRGANNVEQPIQQQTSSIDEQMQENGVTDNMLANSNEPSFKGALDEKNKAKTQSQAATSQFRNNENQQLAKTQGEAQAQAGQQIAGMHTARKAGLSKVHGNQGQTANKDTEKRKEIADKINGIYNTAKTDVDKILATLDTTVAYKFAMGSKAAKAAFEKHVDDNMAAYKKKRYGDANKSYGVLAAAGLWLWDKATGLPDEVNKYFVTGKDVYIKTMDRYITDIANHVAGQLNAAKSKIAKGKKDVQDYVNSLSPSLRKLGKEAISEIQGKFNALEENVNSKKDALIDVLAKKYAENVASIDARIEELKAQNSGFINQALNALSGIFAFIIEVKNTLMNLLAKIVEVVGAIISDPIGFFSNLIAGVGQGFSNFITNIWTHLKTGFFGWLTGSMKGITITMPEDIFSIKGIFSLSMQVLGLGWEGIRAIGATVVGEPLMKMLETGVEVVQVVKKDGIAGLWEYLKDQFADLKETVMDAIMDIIQNQVIQAGIKWILGLLSPVGAFVKAIMAIIDVVKFFIQRAAQIAELIKAFMDSVAAIASGKVGAVAKAIENALAKAVPVLIGLLASILGISGLADKVLGVIRKIRQRITAGITKFWNFVKEKGKKVLGKIGIGNKPSKKKPEDKHINNMDSEIAPETFSMNGKGHTLTFEKGKIYMSTEKDKLSTKIGRSLNYLEKHPDAPELNSKGAVIKSRLQQLKGETTTSEKVLEDSNKLSDSDPNKAQNVKAAQKSLDKLSLNIATFGNEYKLIDLAGEYQTKELGDMGLKVGQHKLEGAANRQSHHVPEKELRNSLVDFYSTVGDVLNESPDYEDLGKKLDIRHKTIKSKFNDDGEKLPAILIHQETHKVGGDKGIHNKGSQKEAYENIKKIAEKSGQYQLVMYDEKEQQIRASFRKHHYKELVAKVYDLVESGKSNAQIVKEEKGIIIHLKGEEKDTIMPIGGKIRDLITTFEGQSVQDIENNRSKILKDVNKTAEQSFDQSFKISMNALTLALENHKHLEGDEKTRKDAIAKIRTLSRDIWREHIYKEIE